MVSHSQSLKTGFGLTGDQALGIRKCSVLPSQKSGVRGVRQVHREWNLCDRQLCPKGAVLIHLNTPIPSTDEAAGSEVHIYRPTVPGLEPTTTGREPSALPNLTDELYIENGERSSNLSSVTGLVHETSNF